MDTFAFFWMIVAFVLGILTAGHFYAKASRELRRQAGELRRHSVMLVDLLQAMGAVGVARDAAGTPVRLVEPGLDAWGGDPEASGAAERAGPQEHSPLAGGREGEGGRAEQPAEPERPGPKAHGSGGLGGAPARGRRVVDRGRAIWPGSFGSTGVGPRRGSWGSRGARPTTLRAWRRRRRGPRREGSAGRAKGAQGAGGSASGAPRKAP